MFSVLTSLEPAAGALFGLLVLGQHLAWPQWLGIATVACASVAATLLGAGQSRKAEVSAQHGQAEGAGTTKADSDLTAVRVE